ncbi:protein MpUGT31 [Marchantia polymorpha subsp. ruderalis]|uniref:Glycosyltransferase n=2 Tax=Marchantia polymorpha TaxID=3197 RepID=A0AAF6BUZ9_MARPO|nr:hypothetical protein MARPO_0099s0001 [Marchantia polymorpha]BBN15833.1 hypothetical protein Mp_7g01270 [Marchantia polymorpha subsp. ruderalis]|eukprot:PTQ32360.1 hypothetical protein MARPO_0099s0001 [Marchantia polymorpha]
METNGHQNGSEMESRTHLLMVPMVQQAHISTAIRFAKKLSKRGVIITFVTLKKHAEQMRKSYSPAVLLKLNITIEALDDYQCMPTPLHLAAGMKPVFQPLVQKLKANKKAGLPGPTCILADRFLTWMKEVADELDLPRYAYASNAAITTRLMQVHHEIKDKLIAVPDGPKWILSIFEEINKMPGLEFLRVYQDIPPVSKENGWFQFFLSIGEGFATADGIVFNSFSELEGTTIQHIHNAFPGRPDLKVAPIYPIGPLSTLEDFQNELFTGDAMEDSHEECLDWLALQPTKSVLYVCLGSQVRLFGEQISHLARALESSQQKFLWVLSKGRNNFQTADEVLPPGFSERTRGRGKVVTGWVGQLELLAHRSMRGFMSHCGWQSVMESLTYGVPILGWPHFAEQHLNCRYVQEILHAGLRVAENDGLEMVQQHEFESSIKIFMDEAEGHAAAKGAAEIKLKAAAAVASGGSSDLALDELARSFRTVTRRT